MQLATAPRPHPPPVPPRPSRQVVAEALKRSPRPPCPTRQAPPPPDTKPWRAQQQKQKQKQEQENEGKDGRTIIYESASKITNGEQKIEDKSVVDGPGVSRISESTVSPELHQGRVLSERNERNLRQNGNIVRQRPTPVERQQPPQHVSRSNLMAHQPPKIVNVDNEQAETAKETKFRNQRHIQIVNGAIVFEARNPVLVKSKDANCEDTGIYDNNNSSVESKADDRTDEATAKELKEMEPEDKDNKGKLSSSTISTDDCATVVVIDEPEKRVVFEDSVNIQHQDWLEAGVRYSSTKITLSGDEVTDEAHDSAEDQEVNGFDYYDDEQLISAFDFASIKEKIAMSSLQGLPPLPRSLSGFNLNTTANREGNEPPPPPARSSSRPQRGARTNSGGARTPPQGRQLTTLDTQLAKLRREMFGLRQLDLSLLSQLWSLNESIQEFRQLLQEQDDRAPSPSPSSEEGDDTSYGSHPPPHPRRPPPVSHHHRAPRPPPRNDSPSSEEYGAV